MSVVAYRTPTGYSYLIIICVPPSCVYVVGVWDCGWTVDRGMWRLLVRPASSMSKCASRASHTLVSNTMEHLGRPVELPNAAAV